MFVVFIFFFYIFFVFLCFFFFSSRRRHTRFDCDWSSDVCSSDLGSGGGGVAGADTVETRGVGGPESSSPQEDAAATTRRRVAAESRRDRMSLGHGMAVGIRPVD